MPVPAPPRVGLLRARVMTLPPAALLARLALRQAGA